MSLYKIQGPKLDLVREKKFSNEKEMQNLIEKNLEELFGLDFIASEFQLKGLRIDTLAYDPETKAFVIVEYKNTSNFSVIDQGYAYLSLLLDKKAEFILAYNEKAKIALKKDDIDWSQARVIFVSPVFSKYQTSAIGFRDLPIELWKISLYDGKLLYLEKIEVDSEASIKEVSVSKEKKEVVKELKVYEERDHLNSVSEDTKELYVSLKDRVLSLGKIQVVPRKFYIAFKAQRNFLDVEFQKKRLKCFVNLRKGELDDPKKVTRDVSNIGHYGNGDYEFLIEKEEDIDYAMTLIRQSYKKNY